LKIEPNIQINVRAYQATDRESCRRLWRELAEYHREIYNDYSIGWECPEDYFDMHLAKVGADRIWVATVDSSVVGFAGLVVEGEEVKLDPIVVGKPFRRKGIGKKLVKLAISEAQKLGAKHLNVEPVARNAEAIKFYRELGFANVGYVQLFIDFSGKKWTRSLRLHKSEFDY
jgi:GNAT superfamily N-acetyltransferase